MSWLLSGLLTVAAAGQTPAELAANFAKPPESARPWVYWFWLNGNITREGITADLEAMKRVGIGGVLIMEVDQGAPVGPMDFMSGPWRELFKHVVAEAGRLGLEVNMNNDAGWNGSGGPWIKPEESMQRLVTADVDVEGPRRFEDQLPRPSVTADYYRDVAVLAFPAPGSFRIAGINAKAAFEIGWPAPAAETQLGSDMLIERDKIVDLTAQMEKDGRLKWDVPAGRWTIVRFGHTSTGVVNAPAPATGRGLECDKLSKAGIEANFNGMMAKLIADVGPAAGKVLVTTHIDSWENGTQNWTARMREEFQQRRGYDLMPYLPVVTGRVVTSLEASERFLWDLRVTVSELILENYAGRMRELANQHGLKLSIEAYTAPCDEITYAGVADEPMGEFWIGGGAMETLKEMSSGGHVYGKPIIGAEAFTANDSERWQQHPGSIKALGDRAFCDGINRFVFHRYAMQPWLDRKPGMTMGPWGLHYERTNTWWEWSGGWHEYLARCQYLLRQGRFVADLCYLQHEAGPQNFVQHPPQPYDFDNCSAHAVMTRMKVVDGRIVLPDGMSYRLLVLPEVRAMTPALLAKIKDLVAAGATIVGPRPLKSPSLSDYPKCDEDVKRLGDELYGDCDGQIVTEHRFGEGRVIWGVAPEKVLAGAGVPPDFTGPTGWRYIHRSAGDADIYFVSNPTGAAGESACVFRVNGKTPELWWPESGKIELAAAFAHKEKNGGTTVLLTLGPSESVFVVFRRALDKLDGGMAVSLARDGKALWSVAGPVLKPVVKSARYGVLDDAQRTRDVKTKVQTLVDQGECVFRVRRLAEDDDPAKDVVKTLEVEYDFGDKHCAVRGKDEDVVHLTGSLPRITVENAVYGVLGDAARTRDVKAKVQRLADLGLASFVVARMAEGDDPAFGVVKTLVVEYTADGRRYTARGTDPELVSLVPSTGRGPAAEVCRGADGALFLKAAQPGQYELRTGEGQVVKLTVPDLPSPRAVEGAWDVSFPQGWGAPERVRMEKLIALSESADEGVKHFSGIATYARSIDIPADMVAEGRRLYLDLGRVEVMAEVTLNGKPLGILWRSPYRVDITGAARAGQNDLEVKVVNQWINRMIGDELLPEDSERNDDGTLKAWPKWLEEGKPSPTGRFTFTSWRLWRKGSPLVASGLIGPVTLECAAVVPVK